jgi:Domain of unknown function (DUF4326)
MDPLAKLTSATTWLAEARSFEDVKQIIDLAEAARTYTRAAKLGLEASNYAAEIKLRAERKAGEILRELERIPPGGNRRTPEFQDVTLTSRSEYAAVLQDGEIPVKTAHRWQIEASIPDDLFEQHIVEVKEQQRELTSAGLRRLAAELKEAADVLDAGWSESEICRRQDVEQGWTRIANMKTDLALIAWAKEHNVFERIDRMTEWGNPFLYPADGERIVVVENYQWFLDNKPSLLAKLDTLKGKVLGCWCHPEQCHGDVLQEYADDTAD